MLIQEDWIDATKGHGLGDSGLYEPFTDNIKELFKNLQCEYGKCISKIYINKNDDSAMPVGWVFQKRVKYDDCNEMYILETWITLHENEPTKTIEYNYHVLKG